MKSFVKQVIFFITEMFSQRRFLNFPIIRTHQDFFDEKDTCYNKREQLSQTFLKNSTVFSSEIINAKQKVLQRIFSNNKLCEEPNAYNLNDLFFFLLWRDFGGEWTKRQI